MNQTIQYQLINPSGNITAIVSGKYSQKQKQLINTAIFNDNQSVEQIGYVNTQNNQKYFDMMGNEFSANGCRAAGYYFLQGKLGNISFVASGLNQPVEIEITKNKAKLIFTKNLVPQFLNNQTKMFGTKFYLINSSPNEQLINQILIDKTKTTGIMFYQQNKIFPYFYVPSVGKTIFEQSCGSGSLVLALFLRQKQIIQPSGEILKINFNPLSLSGQIKFINNSNVRINL